MIPTPPVPQRSRLPAVCSFLAFAVPLLVTALRVSGVPEWRQDEALLRGLGFLELGGAGVLSGIFAQLAALLPLGGRLLRVGLVSAFAGAIASRLVYELGVRLLARQAESRLGAPLALAAALTATLSPVWQEHATTAGGTTTAVALALGAWLLAPPSSAPPQDGLPHQAPRWLLVGALLGLCAAESHWTAGAAAAALLVRMAAEATLPTLRSVFCFFAGVLTTLLLSHAPLLLSGTRLGFGLGAAVSPLVAAPEVVGSRAGSIATWLAEVGPISVGLAALGAVIGIAGRRTRPALLAVMTVVVLDSALRAQNSELLAADPLAALRLLAVSALSVSSSLAVQACAVSLVVARVFMAQAAAILLVVFDLTLVLVTAEASGMDDDESERSAAEVWTDEALGALPQDSLLLVRSSAVARRLLAARLVRGERPDIVIVPVPWLSRSAVTEHLLELEPALSPILRDFAMNGRPGEYALSSLADIRPLFVELDPEWDRRLLEHLEPRPMWIGFAPHALGRSDRRAALSDGRRAFRRVLDVAREAGSTDPATLAVLGSRARQQAIALAAIGDRTNVGQIMGDLRLIDPAEPVAGELARRLAATERRVDARDLLQ